MMSKARRVLVALALAGSLPAGAESPVRIPELPSVTKPDPATAERGLAAYARASKAWRRGQLTASLSAATEAFGAVPNASTALIVATVLTALKRPCDAFDYLLLASDLDASAAEAEATRAALATESKRCAPGYGWVLLELEPGTASATLDGSALPAHRTIGVSAGTHALDVRAPGHVARARPLEVVPGSGAQVHVALAAAPRVEPVVASEPPPVAVPQPLPTKPAPPSNRALGWGLVGGGAGALALSGVLFALAIDEADTLADLAGGARGDYDDSVRAVRAYEGSAWAVGAAGVGVLVWGIVVLALDSADVVQVKPTVDGLVVGGRF